MSSNAIVFRLALVQGRDGVRSRWILLFTGFFLLLTEGLLRFSGDVAKATLSLATVSLMVIPLATLLLSTIHVYNSREFVEVLLAQPIRRSALFAGLYLGLAVPMATGFVGGVGIPLLVRGGGEASQWSAIVTLLLSGAALTFVFTALAFCVALRANDRLRGVGIAFGIWLLISVLYDGLVLIGLAVFADYSIERPLLGLVLANPVDLARVLLLLRLDAGALMGYTGAVFARFFAGTGVAVASAMLCLWIATPVALGARWFNRKDF
jgi:Cu-processing system permease protein